MLNRCIAYIVCFIAFLDSENRGQNIWFSEKILSIIISIIDDDNYDNFSDFMAAIFNFA